MREKRSKTERQEGETHRDGGSERQSDNRDREAELRSDRVAEKQRHEHMTFIIISFMGNNEVIINDKIFAQSQSQLMIYDSVR